MVENMLSKKEIYKQAYAELSQRRLKRQLKKDSHLKHAVSVCPEIGELCSKLGKTSIKLSKSLLYNSDYQLKILNRISHENIKIQNEINELLIKNHLPRDFLFPKAECEKCDDYGFVNNEKCSCLIKLIKSIITEDLRKSSRFNLKSFDDFNLQFYSKEIDEPSQISPYEQMSKIFMICKEFANKFPYCSNGFVMCGLTGLGKTHLSLAIASEVISKGFTVIYSTSSEITRNMADRYFGHTTNSDVDYLNLIVESDLFILDDLGAEFDSSFNKSAIFDIFNSRTPLNRPTIINTNLYPEQLQARYGERVASRIFSTLDTFSFIGVDNRFRIGKKQ